jgi:CrcB protein
VSHLDAVKLLWLAGAGAVGTLARAGLSHLVHVTFPEFPWGTLAVNMVGCFLFGLVWSLSEGRLKIPPDVRFIVLTGFMGAFTTFSSYIFEVGMLAQDQRFGVAVGNLAFQNVVGLLMLFAGLVLGKAV